MKPNFFLVGAPKAGTTSLYHYLDQHPEIYMSPIKEPHYFSDEIRVENFSDEMRRMDEPRLQALHDYLSGPVREKFSGGPISEWTDYLKLFQHADGEKAIGEASVCYLWSKTAPGNIAARFPDAKILMVLRDPVERAFSQHLHMLNYAKSYMSLRAHVDAALDSKSTRIGKLYPFLEFGLYDEQVRRYLALFPREHIRIYWYEDYRRNPRALLRDAFEFLGVDPRFEPDLSLRYLEARVPRSYLVNRFRLGPWQRMKDWVPVSVRGLLREVAFPTRNVRMLQPADRTRLRDFYREGVGRLAKLLDRDLSAWLS